MLTDHQKKIIAADAVAAANEAITYGATKPWGDGETLPSLEGLSAEAVLALSDEKTSRHRDLELSRDDVREVYKTFDAAFRSHIDSYAPKAVQS